MACCLVLLFFCGKYTTTHRESITICNNGKMDLQGKKNYPLITWAVLQHTAAAADDNTQRAVSVGAQSTAHHKHAENLN